MNINEIKLLRISKTTWDRLSKHAKYGDTHNDIVICVLDKLDKRNKRNKLNK